MKIIGPLVGLFLGLAATSVLAQATSQEAKVPGGAVKVTITRLPTAATIRIARGSPRLGVSPSVPTATQIARMLDNSAKVEVVSPARFSPGGTGVSFDTGTRAEFAEALLTGCRQSRADYALYGGAPEATSGASPTAYLFGFGRARQTSTFEMRLYDCRTREPVWDATVAIEASAGIWTNMLAGKVSGGGGVSEEAAAQIIANNLIADMGLVHADSAPPGPVVRQSVSPPPPPTSAAGNNAAVTMTKPGRLYSVPSAKGRVLKTLTAGAILYPTGSRQGVWQEVTDEEGSKGWVSSQLVEPYPQ